MIRHGASHGAAALVATVAAGLMVHVLKDFVPDLLEWVRPIAVHVSGLPYLGWLDEEQLNTLVLAALLAFVWGMVFKWRRVR